MGNNRELELIALFEFGEWKEINNKADLKVFLQHIWQETMRDEWSAEDSEDVDSRYQPFLKFDDNWIRANNYVGFIQNGNQLIEIYPKVFKEGSLLHKKVILKHIFYWLSYCRKWKFPFTQASLKADDIEIFPELIIYIFAKEIFDVVSLQPYLLYQNVEDRTTTPKGSIKFTRYINQSISKGNYHFIECDHEPFVYDNKVNRVIKYCSRLLLSQTKLSDTQLLIQEILFILDEVADIPCTINDINSISFNAFFNEYSSIMQLCKSIVENQMYSNNSYELSQWCLLFPMEYVFEDFVAGFIEKRFSDKWNVEYQKSNAYLTDKPKAFQMKHDIFLTSKVNRQRQIIIDTKYKLRYYSGDDKKAGISQSDLYQVVTYAYRRGCKEVLLIYPNVSENLRPKITFEVHSGFDKENIITINVIELPFWSLDNFQTIDQMLVESLTDVLK